MRVLGLIIAVEARSYEKRDKTKVEEEVLTCIDFDESNIRLKDTVDVVISKSDFTMIKDNPIGQQIYFDVQEITRNEYSKRFRFAGRLEYTQFQRTEATAPKKAA